MRILSIRSMKILSLYQTKISIRNNVRCLHDIWIMFDPLLWIQKIKFNHVVLPRKQNAAIFARWNSRLFPVNVNRGHCTTCEMSIDSLRIIENFLYFFLFLFNVLTEHREHVDKLGEYTAFWRISGCIRDVRKPGFHVAQHNCYYITGKRE